jgi:hypothetical protein
MKSATVCPVPHDQQPLQEYKALQESWFFGWACSPQGWRLYRPSLILWGVGCLLVSPIASITFPPSHDLMHMVLITLMGGGLLPLMVLLRLYLGWRYVRGRLFSETVVYEESGWYDGQVWPKPSEELDRDRLVANYEVQPLLQRLERQFGFAALICLGGILAWPFA